jgi:hypothetical protein
MESLKPKFKKYEDGKNGKVWIVLAIIMLIVGFTINGLNEPI